MEHTQNWVIAEFKKLRFVQPDTGNGSGEWDRSQVTFPTQTSAQEFIAKIPCELKQELGLRLEGNPETGSTSIVVKHAPLRRLMAQDFSSYISQNQSVSKAIR